MTPTTDQVRVAAYHRWERRGHAHGKHLDDWVAAEQAVLFADHYEILAAYHADQTDTAPLGRTGRRVCRFCEQAEPRTRFAAPAPALPACLGLDTPIALDQCDDCRRLFREGLDGALAGFLSLARSDAPTPDAVPIAAYKALVRAALAILPEEELELFPDAVEWVCNPDHDLDGLAFAGRGMYLHHGPAAGSTPWAALARKRIALAPMPSLIFFVGGSGLTIQMPVPLGAADEELEGECAVPRVAWPLDPLDWRGDASCRFHPVAAAPARRRLALSWAE
jgi:hypothetical protein